MVLFEDRLKKVPYHESVENYMMNVIWPAFIVISFIYAIFAGRVNEINEGIFNSASDAVQLSITFRNNLFVEWNNGDCKENFIN